MVTKLKTLLPAAVTAATLGVSLMATLTPARAFNRFPRYSGYYYEPNLGYAAGDVAGNAIAAGSYPYYEGSYAARYGAPAYGARYFYPYPGYGFYYGY